jgi:hypothetical protein
MDTNSYTKVVAILSPEWAGTLLLMQILGALGMRISYDMNCGRFENQDGLFKGYIVVDLRKRLLTELDPRPTLPLADGWLQAEVTSKICPKLRIVLNDQT